VLIAVAAFVLAAVELSRPAGSPSRNNRTVESMFEDDSLLLLQPATAAGDAVVQRTVRELKALGVDRLRLLVEWQYIAPPQRPANFDGADPDDYTACAWAPYDRIVRDARAAGVGVDFDLSGPAPAWAAATSPAGVTAGVYYPDATAFGRFVEAVGTRYSGRYTPASTCSSESFDDSGALPRVSFWSVWNEPNQKGWLSPQYVHSSTGYVPESPRLYRSLVDAYWQGLKRSGHGPETDTILVGELAPEGCPLTGTCPNYRSTVDWPITPIAFVQALYCLGGNEQPLTGPAAGAEGCSASANAGQFVQNNPALFRMTGFAHHPYDFYESPSASLPEPQFVPLADLGRLQTALDDAFDAYGVERQLPLYLTEYGYVTHPPNPYFPISPAQQSKYLNEAAYLAYEDPRVRALGQYELIDPGPNTQYPVGSRDYWETFQEGLVFTDGKPKPAFGSYRLPIWLPQTIVAAGGSVPVWGMLRVAPNNTSQTAEIQWRSRGGAFKTIAAVTTDNPSGFLETRVTPPGSGAIQIAWKNASGQTIDSRAVGVQVAP
jgi:hypothetical protein